MFQQDQAIACNNKKRQDGIQISVLIVGLAKCLLAKKDYAI